ncbi:MAG: (Fe-S)-binding protein [Candidatus Kryptonium sp.]|nr:(Fe-S)-binding protein [Candidatus Kryptonium sp.]MDW8109134.1 (Fe-S)-binding protein [Candidatus Kryptonium sp.]
MAGNENIQKVFELLDKQLNQPLKSSLEVCARCGICAEACHYYVSEPKLEHVPAFRAEQLRKIYRRKYNFFGKYFPWLVNAQELDEEQFNKLVEIAFSECTLCRRCTFNCPLGVDTPLVMRVIRAISTATGKAPEILVMLADSAIAKGENPEIFKEIFIQQISELEKELQELTGDKEARIPVEKEGARVLYVGLAGAHSILPPAIIFNEVKEDWSLSVFEAANYGVFLGDVERAKKIAKRIIDEAKRLRVQEVIIAECGHATTALVWDAPNWFGEQFPFKVRSIVEIVAEYIQSGKLILEPDANLEAVTYHDSCNLARASGILKEPRIILNSVVKNFKEMNPHGVENYCCGGGGGLVALPEYYEKRMKAGKAKAEQIRKTGAKIVATACENCKLQLNDLNNYYNLGIEVKGLVDLVANAILHRKSIKQEKITS